MIYLSKYCNKQFPVILVALISALLLGSGAKANPGSTNKFDGATIPYSVPPIRPQALLVRKFPNERKEQEQAWDLFGPPREAPGLVESDNELAEVDLTLLQDDHPTEQRNTADLVIPDLEEEHPELPELFVLNSQQETTTATPAERDAVDKQTVFIACSAFLAGLVEVFCHARYGCFVNMMTGNTIRFASFLAKCKWKDCLTALTLIGSYMLGVGWMSRIQSTLDKQQTTSNNAGGVGSMVAPMVALIFTAADCLSRLCSTNHGLLALKILQAPLLAVGFGLVNAASSHFTGGTVLFAMTGHFAKVATALQEGIMPFAWDAATRKACNVLCSFMGGAFLSTLYNQHSSRMGTVQQSLPPFCTSIGILYAALFIWYEEPFSERLQSFLTLMPSSRTLAKRRRKRVSEASSLPCHMDVLYCDQDRIAKDTASF